MFHDLKSLLPKSIKRTGIAPRLKTTRAIETFNEIKNEILGPELAVKVRPMYIKNKILVVASLSSAATEQLRAREKKIIEKVNKKFRAKVVEEIKYIT